jgi:hypothetical protein
MKKVELKTIKKEVVTDITCDCCGKSCNTEYGFEFMDLKANWGYCSNHDLQTWTAQVCEDCIVEKFGFVNFNKDKSKING